MDFLMMSIVGFLCLAAGYAIGVVCNEWSHQDDDR